MQRIPLSIVPAMLVAGVLTACSSTQQDPTAKWTPDRIYTEAVYKDLELNHKNQQVLTIFFKF